MKQDLPPPTAHIFRQQSLVDSFSVAHHTRSRILHRLQQPKEEPAPPAKPPLEEHYNYKGLSGLANLGNTCFLNSCLQVLSHTHEFGRLLDNPTYLSTKCDQEKPEADILMQWNDVRKTLWHKNCVVSPNGFVGAVQEIAQQKKRELFTGWAQNDLPEFLVFLFECFHEALSRKVRINIVGNTSTEKDKMATKCYQTIQEMYEKDFSEIITLFYGTMVSTICYEDVENRCDACQYKPEPFFLLSVPMKPTLYEALVEFTKDEVLTEDNMWFNEKTGKKQMAVRHIKFWNLPPVLVIDIKRFQFAGSFRKGTGHMSFPLVGLDMSEFICGYGAETYVYDIYAVCNHYGGMSGGHYTAFVKESESGNWYHFNDTQVTYIPAAEVESRVVSPAAYCLFYRKRPV